MAETVSPREMSDTGPEPGRSLVVLSGSPNKAAAAVRASSALVAHLLAARMDVPQTRARRRAGSREGVAAYGAAGETIRIGGRPRGLSWHA